MPTLTLEATAEKGQMFVAYVESTGFGRLEAEGDVAYAERYIRAWAKARVHRHRREAQAATVSETDIFTAPV